ncbi:MAG: SDR family NAD(P)-dependent oxidoreductase, partial [Thermoguttaceae bacterium]|nr:SDR family NAD(P)-dependent oxidoreductase [Thermoguttaceae bacterium]
MKRELKNARIILTGASSGIGRQLALQAAKAGAKLVLTARRVQLLEEVKTQIESETGGNCAVELVVGDITVQETREAVVNRCVEAFGGVDVLINNAGAAASGEFETGTPDRLERVMALNLTAPVEMIRLVLPIMKKWKEAPAAQGKPIPPMIVNLSSVVGLRGVTHYSEYCAGKAAIRAFSQSIRTEFHRYGIDV